MSFMRNPIIPVAAVVLLVAGAGSLSAGSITGTVKYEGQVPTMRPIDMSAEPTCKAKYDSPPRSEMLVLGEGNTIANIFVHVKVPAGDYKPSADRAVLDQDGCRYLPHVLGVMVGQEFKILNNDGIMHNVHALPKVNSQFNMAMPASRTEAVHTFGKEESMFKIKCDVHPWMNAYVAVMTHPFFDTTAEDGRFSISGLPAGTYDVEIWHEKLGTKTAKVTVTGDGTEVADFVMSPPSR